MADEIVIFCTCANQEEASGIARTLIEERLAACVNILPTLGSIYRWNDAIETTEEILMVIKSAGERFPALRDRIAQLHSYETPEIIALPIVDGTEKYLSWLREQL